MKEYKARIADKILAEKLDAWLESRQKDYLKKWDKKNLQEIQGFRKGIYMSYYETAEQRMIREQRSHIERLTAELNSRSSIGRA